MNRKRTILLILVLFSLRVSGQILMPVAGINYSWSTEKNSQYNTYYPIVRPVFGFGTEVQLSPSVDLIPSLLYTIKGTRGKPVSSNRDYAISRSYIALPLIFDYNLGSFGLNGGIVPGYWISERTKLVTPAGKQISVLNFNNPFVAGHYNRFELAFEIGLRYAAEFDFATLNFYLSYKQGVTPLFQPDFPQSNYNYVYNQWMQLKVGMPIKISG